jgi:DNA polymerase III delta prime subunit
MEELDINKILGREQIAEQVKQELRDFEHNKTNPTFKTGIYICGESGVGKTEFALQILKEMNYDIVRFDAGDVRNKQVIDDIAHKNMSNKNVMSLLRKDAKKIAILMDEIDGMNNGDKGGINTLIKLMRPKKTKKQKADDVTLNPIICIGSYKADKKIKELMKVCNVIDLQKPTDEQIKEIMDALMPGINISAVSFVRNDLRRLNNLHQLYTKNPGLYLANKNEKKKTNQDIITNIFQTTTPNDDAKNITAKLIRQNHRIEEHANAINETDRTSVGLLWHENVIDLLGGVKKDDAIAFYLDQLTNICYSDYIDRITFQKQIWQFNEMSSLMKTFQNSKLFHQQIPFHIKNQNKEIRFTKVLTKYSTEYNNSLFIQRLCQLFGMDKKDLIHFFYELRLKHDDEQILKFLENYEITKLDVNRIYRYIDKYIKEDAPDMPELKVQDFEEEEQEEELE